MPPMTNDSTGPGLVPGVLDSLIAAVVLGAVSTFGDWLWANFIPDGAIVPGVLHGVAIFFVLAVVLAYATHRRSAYGYLLWRLPVAGALIAASFYPLYFVLGYLGSLLATWMAMWLVLAWLHQKARGDVESLSRSVLRAGLAAILSGLAFWAISGIWTSAEPVTYAWRFACWSFAFLPGFLALLFAQPRAAGS